MESDIAARMGGRVSRLPARPIPADQIRPEVRGVAALVAAVLLAAWAVLYLQPGRTGELFAWKITPDMSPMFMGAAYGAGAYYFARVVLGRRWHQVAYYFPGIALFTWMMGIATFLHWNAFTPEPFSLECLLEPMGLTGTPLSFYTWLLLYVTTPFLVPMLWLRQRGADPGTPDPDDRVVPRLARRAGALGGALLLALGLGLFLFPAAALPYWPWRLTPLMAQVVGAFLAAPGLALLLCARDPRWSAWRLLVQHQVLAVVGVLLAVFLLLGRPDNPQPDNPLTWVFVGGQVAFLGSLLLLLGMMARRPRPAPAPAEAP